MSDEEFVEMPECDNCGGMMDEGDTFKSVDDAQLCGDCIAICDNCNDIYGINDSMVNVDHELWCESCADNHADYCSSCNEYSNDRGTAWVYDRGETWCETCLMDYAVYCEECDNYYANGCPDCELSSLAVHDWSYKPDPIFHSVDKDERMFFGIEVEMEGQDMPTLNMAAEYADDRLSEDDLGYLKRDGSLDNGFELVTHPMSYEYYRDYSETLWGTLETLRSKYYMRSWDTRTCGLHIHISRTGFTSGAHMHRFMNLVYTLQDLFEALAGRSSSRWASFEDVRVGKVTDSGQAVYWKSFAKKINEGRNTDRYTAINCQNQHTLEMRIFKGTLNRDTIMAHISLAHASVEYTRNMSVHDITNGALDIVPFAKYIYSQPYPELHERLTRALTKMNIDIHAVR